MCVTGDTRESDGDAHKADQLYADAMAAYRSDDYGTAMKGFEQLADRGHPKAQFNLGIMHADGSGVARDARIAAALYRQAAERGHASAQFQLGLAYSRGEGVPGDAAEAAKWLNLAAEQGLAPAQTCLAIAYHNGLGVPADAAQSLHWFRAAADQGEIAAQYSLGNAYRLGNGVPRDPVQACAWFTLAIFHPGPLSAFERGTRDLAIRYRDEIAEDMRAEQLAEAETRAAVLEKDPAG